MHKGSSSSSQKVDGVSGLARAMIPEGAWAQHIRANFRSNQCFNAAFKTGANN